MHDVNTMSEKRWRCIPIRWGHTFLHITCLLLSMLAWSPCVISTAECHLIWELWVDHKACRAVVDYLSPCLFVLQGHKWIWGNQEICGHKVSTCVPAAKTARRKQMIVYLLFLVLRQLWSNVWTLFWCVLLSLVAIYLGIKKRPSPGPSDVAGIWEAVCGGTLQRWYWLCGRRRSDVAARSTMPAPFCSPAPMAWQGAAWLSRPRCAIFPQAPPRLLTGCATRDSGGHR